MHRDGIARGKERFARHALAAKSADRVLLPRRADNDLTAKRAQTADNTLSDRIKT